MPQPPKSYYSILGVPESATLSEIRKAYRQLSLKLHPDKGGSDEAFARLSEAYETLKDPAKRATYNAELHRSQEAKKESANAAEKQTGYAAQYADRDSHNYAGNSAPRPYGHTFREVLVAAFKYTGKRLMWFTAIAALIFFVSNSLHTVSMASPSTAQGSPPVVSQSTPPTVANPNTSSSATNTTPDSPSTTQPTAVSCPSGAPNISIANVSVQPQVSYLKNDFGNPNMVYTVTGILTNNSTDTISVQNVGFYLGDADSSLPPDWQDSFASINSEGTQTVAPGQTVSWTAEQVISADEYQSSDAYNQVSASLDYPASAGASATLQWQWSDADSSCTAQ